MLFTLVLALAMAPSTAAAACVEGLSERTIVELYLGRNIGNELGVSNAAFRRFLDREVTPRFPNGFTVVDMVGQYRSDESGPIVKEPGKLLIIALGETSRDMALVREITEAYKAKFRQQSVGIVARTACVKF